MLQTNTELIRSKHLLTAYKASTHIVEHPIVAKLVGAIQLLE